MVLERIANPSSGESRFLSSSLSRTAITTVFSSMDRILGFDPSGVGSIPTGPASVQ
jgi:hypothetical protein